MPPPRPLISPSKADVPKASDVEATGVLESPKRVHFADTPVAASVLAQVPTAIHLPGLLAPATPGPRPPPTPGLRARAPPGARPSARRAQPEPRGAGPVRESTAVQAPPIPWALLPDQAATPSQASSAPSQAPTPAQRSSGEPSPNMSGFTTPAHEGFNWFRSAIPPGANDRLVNVAPGQATDVYAGVAEQVIRNIELVHTTLFENQREAHRKQHGGKAGFVPLSTAEFFKVAVYTAQKPAQGLAPLEFAGWRAIVFWLEPALLAPRLKLLAKSETRHGVSAKQAMQGLLDVTAHIVWDQHYDVLMEIERGDDGFFPSRGFAERTRSLDVVPQRLPTPRLGGA